MPLACRLRVLAAACCLAAGLGAVLLAPPARAGEAVYCVTCSNPDQTYLCRVTGEGSSQNDALKLYCIVRTAKDGHHASCSATSKVEGCNGVVKVYGYGGPSLPNEITEDPRVKKLMSRVARDRNTFAKPQGSSEPKTLVELTGRAMSASRQRWHNTFGSDTAPPQRSPLPEAAAIPLPPPTEPTARRVETASRPPPSAYPPPSSPSRVKRAAQITGAAMGSAARTTYHCLRSFFFNCSGETQN
jgi:hypothetical protein